MCIINAFFVGAARRPRAPPARRSISRGVPTAVPCPANLRTQSVLQSQDARARVPQVPCAERYLRWAQAIFVCGFQKNAASFFFGNASGNFRDPRLFSRPNVHERRVNHDTCTWVFWNPSHYHHVHVPRSDDFHSPPMLLLHRLVSASVRPYSWFKRDEACGRRSCTLNARCKRARRPVAGSTRRERLAWSHHAPFFPPPRPQPRRPLPGLALERTGNSRGKNPRSPRWRNSRASLCPVCFRPSAIRVGSRRTLESPDSSSVNWVYGRFPCSQSPRRHSESLKR